MNNQLEAAKCGGQTFDSDEKVDALNSNNLNMCIGQKYENTQTLLTYNVYINKRVKYLFK